MFTLTSYSTSFGALVVVLATLLVQMFIAGSSKAKLPGAIPGKIDPALSHEAFAYRAHRTFHNSLENLPLLLGSAFLAFFIGTNPGWTAAFLWTFTLARLVHMALYYLLVTEKNPSPRSYFYIIALAANAGLLGLCGMTLLR